MKSETVPCRKWPRIGEGPIFLNGREGLQGCAPISFLGVLFWSFPAIPRDPRRDLHRDSRAVRRRGAEDDDGWLGSILPRGRGKSEVQAAGEARRRGALRGAKPACQHVDAPAGGKGVRGRRACGGSRMALPDRRRALGIILVRGPRRPPGMLGQAAAGVLLFIPANLLL